MEQFKRLSSLIGSEKLKQLNNKTVMIFGLGGVGGYVVESLARSGIGKLIIIDNDTIDITNINRQLISTLDNVGNLKTDEWEKRIKQINSNIIVIKYNLFVLPNVINEIDFNNVDYVVDAIDTVTAKISIIEKCKELNIPIICSCGTGNKVDPMRFKITDISKTSVDPLSRVLRIELRKRNIKDVSVLFSDETPIIKEKTPASICYTIGIAGLLISKKVIDDLLK